MFNASKAELDPTSHHGDQALDESSLPTLPASIWADKYRGATIADLDPPPTLSTHPLTPIRTALFAALSHDYTHLTVVSASTRALLGYISVPRLRALLTTGEVGEDDPVERAMLRFQGGRKNNDEDRDHMKNSETKECNDKREMQNVETNQNKEHTNHDGKEGEEAGDMNSSPEGRLVEKGKDMGGDRHYTQEEEEAKIQGQKPRRPARKDKYQVMTMDTPLEVLEAFFRGDQDGGKADNKTTGSQHHSSERDFAIVTDAGRRFVLGVATRADLEEFVRRRP